MMKTRKLVLSGVLGGVLICGGTVLAQAPTVTIDSTKHPNLAEAQHHIQQAYQKIDDAQQANKEQLGGHADKAKQLLGEADRELKAAAEYANHHK